MIIVSHQALRFLIAFSNSNISLTCHCNIEFINFVYTFYAHVITGDLNIIKNKHVKHFINFGTKFRINCKINSNKVLKNFKGIY